MRIAIVTDAWEPQVNGVVNTLKATRARLQAAGHEVHILEPGSAARSFACPTYPEIRLAFRPYRRLAAQLDALAPDCIHIATEGPMGLAARRYCLRHKFAFTSAYHTRFPEYLHARTRLPLGVTYRWLRWFHGPSRAVMVPTPRVRELLLRQGFDNAVLWGRGVDTEHFRPVAGEREDGERPLYLYVGRVSVEKNIEAFLQLDLPGSKWVIGDGPQREKFQRQYPQVHFLGAKSQHDLPTYYASADVFVFPSMTDTFGLVLAEAMACGVPVAAYPVEGPIDVVQNGRSGILDWDLAQACRAALGLDRQVVRQCALAHSWEYATDQFLRNLHPVSGH